MAIGDDLFSLLGLVPSRDRAGIARGTMADEAKASMAVNHSGNAEGNALLAQGAPRPPDFTLPDDINAEYASGKPRAAAPAAPSIIPSVVPPPSERVVASGPAAAPPPAVMRNSDVILKAYEQQNRAARMQQLIGSIGMIANAFNRNPESQARTRESLGTMVAGGGGATAGGLPDLKTVLEMRDKEVAEDRMVDSAKRMFGLSDQDARARFATGELQKLFAPETIAKREADSRAQRTMMELLKPEEVAALSKRLGMSEAVIRAGVRDGSIDPKKLADILSTQASTVKTGVETREKTAEIAGIEEAQKTPAAVAERYRQMGYTDVTEDTIKAASGSKEALNEFNKNHQPLSTKELQELKVENDMREAKGLPKMTPSEYKRAGQQPHVLPDEVGRRVGTEAADKVMNTSAESARTAHQNILDRHMTQDLWREDMLAGGLGAEKQTDWRNTFARLFNLTDEQASDTKLYFSAINRNIQASAKSLPGQLSDKDVRFLKDMEGGQELTPQAIRRLEIIHEKLERMRIAKHNAYFDEQTGRPALGHLKEFYGKYDPPEPGRFIKENLRANPDDVAALLKDPKGARKAFEKEYGMGVADYVIKNEGRIE